MDTSAHSGGNWVDIVSEESDEEIPHEQPRVDPSNLIDQLKEVPVQESYLGEKLIRTEHRLEYLDDHRYQGIWRYRYSYSCTLYNKLSWCK